MPLATSKPATYKESILHLPEKTSTALADLISIILCVYNLMHEQICNLQPMRAYRPVGEFS